MRRRFKPLVDCLFDSCDGMPRLPHGLTLTFHAQRTVGEIQRFFGFPELALGTESVGTLLNQTAKDQPMRIGPFLVTSNGDPDYVEFTYAPEPVVAQGKGEM